MQPDPMMPEKKLKQRIAENNAEMEPLIADVANINSIQDRFVQVMRDACEKTKIEVKTRKEESKEEQIEDSEVDILKAEKMRLVVEN